MLLKVFASLIVLYLFASTPSVAWEKVPAKEEIKIDKSVKEVLWEGISDMDMLKTVRSDILSARGDKDIKTLRVTLLSPGGPVVTSLEIARLVRNASDAGLVVEIHAVALCASGCTFILAAGTPGKRAITAEAFFLVHPPQRGEYGSSECLTYIDAPKSVDDKITNTILDNMRDMYVRLTGKTKDAVEKWITCGNEQVGTGLLAVSMGIADKSER